AQPARRPPRTAAALDRGAGRTARRPAPGHRAETPARLLGRGGGPTDGQEQGRRGRTAVPRDEKIAPAARETPIRMSHDARPFDKGRTPARGVARLRRGGGTGGKPRAGG